MTDRYAVFGHPVAHSQSPWIHARFARQTGQDLAYDKQDVTPEQFTQSVHRFFAGGGRGLNITVPHKESAYRLCNELTPRAEAAGAVNTLIPLDHGRVWGDNTDGAGLLRDMTGNLGHTLRGRRVLVLGAGGAVRGILRPLMEASPAELVIANRTLSRAQALIAPLDSTLPVRACGFDSLGDLPFDVVVNGTAGGLTGDIPPLPAGLFAANDSLAYDLVYGRQATAFMRWAAAAGAVHVHDGLGMLVEQAAESFLLWRGVRPDTSSVIKALRQQLAAQD